ncbi:hypothetical protein TWF970_009091 [Orbilia oligospora]|uniref:Uncharacterized protein n=1 Tax=Orbilia oligospora TaxID=2813651 RepID=A0A7C8V0U5_ORBOL|nr:hypothetical protein TWF970_009091 [Orbilia oligospora]
MPIETSFVPVLRTFFIRLHRVRSVKTIASSNVAPSAVAIIIPSLLVSTPSIGTAMRICGRLSTVICTAHISYCPAGYTAARCQRFLSTTTDEPLPERPPNATIRIRLMKSGPSLPEPEDGSPPESNNDVRRMLREKFPGIIKTRHRERKVAQRERRAKAKLGLNTDPTETPIASVHPTAQERSVNSTVTQQRSMSEIWEKEKKKKKKKGAASLEQGLAISAKDSMEETSNQQSTFPVPTHLGNITNASLGNAQWKYNRVSYDAMLDAVLTLSPGLVIQILQLKEVRRLRDAYLHSLVKEGLQKGDLIYYRTNGAIRIKRMEWADKLHALRVKRDILTCYSVNLETKDIMFDYKLAAKIFGGHEFPTDTRVPGIPWVLSRRRSLTLKPKSSDKHDRDKEIMMEEIAQAGGSTAPTAPETPGETPGVGTENRDAPQAAGTLESRSTVSFAPPLEAQLDGGYEYLRRGR